ncbi:MAG: hypothetical protein AAF414_19025 [Pseudomonadota bacterium]
MLLWVMLGTGPTAAVGQPNSGVTPGFGAIGSPAFRVDFFGFPATDFYRFASGPDRFEPWHRDRSRGDIIVLFRTIGITSAPILVDVGGVFFDRSDTRIIFAR